MTFFSQKTIFAPGLCRRALVFLLCLLPFCALGQEVSVDTSKLDGAVTLAKMPWRFMAADDPAFADSAFQDDRWPLVLPGAPLPGTGALRNKGPLYTWARLHLHVNGTATPLALAFTSRSIFPYAVYANGRLVGMSPGFERPMLQHAEPFAIALPPDREITLAVRIFCSRSDVMRTFPLLAMRVGRPDAVAEGARLTRIEDFCKVQVEQLISLALALAVGTFGATLFVAQRSRREYLWLALLSFTFVAMTAWSVLMISGTVSASPWHFFFWRLSGCLSGAFLLEFAPLLAGVRAVRWVRPLQGVLLFLPVFSFYSDPIFALLLLPTMLLLVALLVRYFVQALRLGNPEAMILSLPMALLVLGLVLLYANVLFPARVPSPMLLHLGMLGLSADQVPEWLLFLAAFGVLQYRFVRVSRMEQRASAEFEAARAIQHMLVPDELPEVPGLRFGSVYQPALQVGGDFFQILPSPSGTLVALGDVSGKGLPAAMTVALLVGTLRTVAEQTDSPAAILAALNRVAHGRGLGFTTCLLLWVDRSVSRLVMASAGHLEPYLDGQAVTLEANLPLGVTADLAFNEHTFPFRAGQVLTLYTDGVVEAFHPQTRELFGFERALAISHLPAASIAAAIETFTRPGTASDDITILTVAAA